MTIGDALGLALLGSGVPVAGWLVFFYTRDRYHREPKRLIFLLLLVGAIPVVVVSGLVNEAAASALGLSATVVLVAPAAEEALKYLGTRLTAGRNVAFDEPIDGMVYGSAVGLGFAFAENIGYLMGGALGTPVPALQACDPGLECVAQLAVLRGLGTALMHAVAAGLAGHFLARRVLGGQPRSVHWKGYALAVLVHAGWNTGILAVPALVGGAWIYIVLAKRALAASPHRLEQLDDSKHRIERFAVGDGLLQPCPSCGRLHGAALHYCTVCGHQLLDRSIRHSVPCPNCSLPQPVAARFCTSCGQALGVEPPVG